MVPLANILMYRDVREPADSPWPRRYRQPGFARPAQLAAQLDRLAAAGRPVVPLSAILAALAGGPPLPGGAVALSFDHGLADHFRVVLPLLTERGLSAAFFLPAAPIIERRMIAAHKIEFVLAAADTEQDLVAAVYDLVAEHRQAATALPHPPPSWEDGHSGADWARQMSFVTRLLRTGLPAGVRDAVVDSLFATFVTGDETALATDLYLSLAQARALAEAGMEVGGHGLTATNLQGLPPRAQSAEISQSAGFLRHLVGVADGLLFSYPHGGWDEATLDALPAQGFVGALTGHRAHVATGDDPFRLPRYDAARDFELALTP